MDIFIKVGQTRSILFGCESSPIRRNVYIHLLVSAQMQNKAQWAIPQYPGHLRREVLIFWQKSLWTIHTYHLVPFKLQKNVQRGPFQGLLVLKYFFQKISNFTNYALTPTFQGRTLSVIPFRKALGFPVAGPYWSLTWWPPPMRNKHIKIGIFNTVTN